ncbi:MAG: hemolysin D [Candidatus Pelagadaptatus aseana]|uniref:hypothetical protein n=1 Tax=Candidatus Pelagadaptatus aseana TaxID=3120508 RepID=UPI0039B26D5A
MSVNVFSKNWYRVENLKPRLKVQIDISSQMHRGERWYVLRDTISGTVQRYSWQAYSLIGLMDGEHSLNQIWENSGDQLEQEMPTQDEVISLVGNLYQSDMLHLNVPANARDLFQRKTGKGQRKLLQKLQSPLAIQVPLFDPTRILDRLVPFLDRLLGWKFVVLYLLLIGWGGVLALRHFDALTNNLADRVLAADNLLLMWFLYPLIKIIHEFGHAYVVRRFGGQVHEMGIMFLVFFPMPYVNATESASFTNKYHRILVSAAGVIVELLIAAVALLFWSISEPGLVKSLLFNVVFMAGVSTILFNGNPLLKFDAYYVLSDYLEIPNLAKKSTSYWGYLFKRYLFGITSVHSPSGDARESFWLFFYNLLSFAYRLFISISIILFVGSKYFVVGVALAIWAFTSGWVIPFGKTISKPFTEQEFRFNGRNPYLVMSMAVVFVWALLFELPLPKTTTVEGVAWVSEDKRLYAGESGFIEQVLVSNGEPVKAGNTITILKNYDLEGEANILEAQLKEAKARFQSVYSDRAKYLVVAEEIKRLETELLEARQSLAQARVVSLSDGQVVLGNHTQLQHSYLERGELLGYILTQEDRLVLKVMLPEHEAEQIARELQFIRLRSASSRSLELPAELIGFTPQVTQILPSLVLSDQAGGVIVMDPSQSEAPTAVENHVELLVASDEAFLEFVEERFFVQFQLRSEPIFWRLYRAVRRVFLEQFNV